MMRPESLAIPRQPEAHGLFRRLPLLGSALLIIGGLGACRESSTEPTSVAVSSLAGPSAVTAGEGFSCALNAQGAAFCWGRNTAGQLGDGSTTDRAVPAPLAGGFTFTAIDAGRHTACGVTTVGTILCWGAGESGQLGDGTFAATSSVPVPVKSTVVFRSVAVGGTFVCGVAVDGRAWCWGDNTFHSAGVLGTGDTISSATPRRVFGDISFTTLSAGLRHVCGLDSEGVGYCWGANTDFQIGNYQFALVVPGPGMVATTLRFRSIAAGTASTCGVSVDGVAYCWGTDDTGVLGLGFHIAGGEHRVRPTPVVGNARFASVVLSAASTRLSAACGLQADGAAYCWGANVQGSLGITGSLGGCSSAEASVSGASCSDSPVPVSTSARFREIAMSGAHSCGITTDDQLLCWGSNAGGELGDGTHQSRAVPTPVR